MIGNGLDSVYLQQMGDVLHFLAAETVNDPRFALVALDEAYDVLFDVLGLGSDLVEQVGPVERGLEGAGLGNSEVLENVFLHLGSRGSRQAYDGEFSDFFNDAFQVPVFGPEVMTPFRDAVRLVDRYKGDLLAL